MLFRSEEEGATAPFGGGRNFSGVTSQQIDEEVRRIIDECYGTAKRLLEENVDILHAMKAALMEYETLDSEQVDDLMARRPVRPPRDWHDGGDYQPGGRPAGREEGGGAPIGGPVEGK